MTSKTIYLAGGCFWGTEHFMRLVNGVIDTEVGFANSNLPNPSYRLVCTGSTNAAETVKVKYDAETISLSDLLKLYFMTIDPTSINRQGNDEGSQYRTGIYYEDVADLPVIKASIKELSERVDKPIVIEVLAITNFYPAEDYHQDYLIKNPNGYCHLSPKLFEYVKSLNQNNKYHE